MRRLADRMSEAATEPRQGDSARLMACDVVTWVELTQSMIVLSLALAIDVCKGA
jgi:hypothetical protein